MRLTVNDASAMPALLHALRDRDCLAVYVGRNTLDVLFPWVESGDDDAGEALTELVFFARVWEACHPGLRVNVVPS
jgi:hypothetical protein